MSDQELKHEQSRNHALVERPTELKKEVARDDSKGSIKDRLVEMQNLATAYDETEVQGSGLQPIVPRLTASPGRDPARFGGTPALV